MTRFVRAIEHLEEKTIVSLTLEVMMDDSGGLWLVDAYNLHYQDRMTNRYITPSRSKTMKVCEGMHYCHHKF